QLGQLLVTDPLGVKFAPEVFQAILNFRGLFPLVLDPCSLGAARHLELLVLVLVGELVVAAARGVVGAADGLVHAVAARLAVGLLLHLVTLLPVRAHVVAAVVVPDLDRAVGQEPVLQLRVGHHLGVLAGVDLLAARVLGVGR